MTTISPPRIAEKPVTKTRSNLRKLAVLLVLALGIGGAFYFRLITPEGVKETFEQVTGGGKHAAPASEAIEIVDLSTKGPWDGTVTVNDAEEKAVGFNIVPVVAQKEPIRLELTGRTAYDPYKLNKIRPRFDTRVERVFAELGQKISKGEPLVELWSTDLASAKNDFQVKYVQWQHDLRLLTLREGLIKTGAISNQLFVDTQNDEQKSKLDFTLAHDKLSIFYEVPKDEIDPLLVGLKDKLVDQANFGSVTEKAKLTIRAKADGIVVERTVVPGNYYESTDVLMEVAPLDHLWVLVNVYELDQDKVKEGMTMQIHFPFVETNVMGKVDNIASQVSKDTRAVKVRASIPNPDGRLKSEMLVTARLEIPPMEGQTVIPRLAMVALNGSDYVFVKEPGTVEVGSAKAIKYRRVKIQVAQENADSVVVSSGLKAGQEVVTNGSLILSQLHEDRAMTSTGMPAN